MTRGKYKRKKQHTQQQVNPSADTIVVVEKEEMAENKAESTGHGTQKTKNDKNPSWKRRFVEWAKHESSFTDWCIAVFAFVLAGASIYQFIILGGQLYVMRKDQRAWIGDKQNSFQTEIGKPVFADFVFQNTGKTPAKNVDAIFNLEVLESTNGPTFNYPAKPFAAGFSGHTIFPNSPINFSITSLIKIPGTETAQPTILTDDLSNKFNNGQIWFAAEGKISYEDIFRHKHWITFCYSKFHTPSEGYASTPAGAEKCTEYNDADDN